MAALLRSEMSIRSALIAPRAQPAFTAASQYHTTAQRPHLHARQRSHQPIILNPSAATLTVVPIARYSSTDSASSAAVAAAPASSVDTRLDWNTYFSLRKSRRRYQLGGSIATSLGTMVTGAQVLAMSDMDAIVGQIPLDPFISLGLITFACGGGGWLLGPVIGTGLFNLLNGKTKFQMAVKEKQFYQRIKQFRVDPSNSSMANPVPDYYGERISSVQGYRQWLKDQRAFNKKRQTFV